jgi:purine-cytosine permease-like protein
LSCGIGSSDGALIPIPVRSFLYLIGTAFAPLFAITITDYFILKKTRLPSESLNIKNAVLWVLGVFLYRYMMNMDTILGSTLPTMIILSLACIVANQFTFKKAGK